MHIILLIMLLPIYGTSTPTSMTTIPFLTMDACKAAQEKIDLGPGYHDMLHTYCLSDGAANGI